MNRQFYLLGVLSSLLIFFVPLGFAQEEEPAGQEVEINEDNYRQFMELKDPRGQRNMLPENAFKPGSGAQKLDKLPEESQKHLRNQLREIIVQGDPWQPGDENTQYPYVPSNAASTNASLEKQEAEAWGELVESYHQREAEIYENSARSQAAMATGTTSQTNKAGQGGEGQESSQQSPGEQSDAADSYSPNAQNDPNATSNQGVSQNAMEFLTGKSSQGGTLAQQGNQEQDHPGSDSAESTTGASQNALEYLTGGQESTTQATKKQNMEGTLTIQDLINAQGVRTATGTGSPAPVDDPDKEGDG